MGFTPLTPIYNGILMHCVDVCGIVVEVGSSVSELKPGDRVFGMADGFLTGNNDHAAHQEYTILKATSTALLPSKLSFRQGATLPTAVATATMGLFDALALPRQPAGNANTGILIWGGASAVGSMAVQLARRAGHTVYTAASKRHHAHLVKIGACFVVDYRAPTAVEDLLSAAASGGTGISCAIDAISTPETIPEVLKVLYASPSLERKLAYTLPWPEDIDNPRGIEATRIIASEICSRREDLAIWMCGDVLPKWLENDEIVPQEQKDISGGLSGLQSALDSLRKGASGEKVVVEL